MTEPTTHAGGPPAPAGGTVAAGELAIELVGIDKRFGPVHANKDIHLAVPRGTIHGIIGENGAGKSTLMSILYGFYQADGGEIRIGGRPVSIGSSSDAIDAGIGMVHQHFMLVEPFTVLENIMLGAEGGPVLRGGIAAARAELTRLEQEYSLEVSPDAVVGDLPVGVQQRVEILKALYRGADILILDEPTGVLTPQEADHLFRILATLKEQGKTVILITHKLREIMAVTDNVSVMRRGEMVAHRRTADTDREELAELMVGRKVLLRVEKGPATPGDVVLDVEALRVIDKQDVTRLKDVSLQVRAGEIVGIAGVSGNGQSELLAALSGVIPFAAGSFSIKGEQVTPGMHLDARAMRAKGMAHVPEDRHREGLITAFEANECTILGYDDNPSYRWGPLLNWRAIVGDCSRQMEQFDVRPPNPRLKAANFSGGNQQKLVLAREISRAPELLLVGQPTRGVDIGAIEFIHRQIIAMRDAGTAVLLVSVELDEIMGLSDRILVMFDGRIVGEIAGSEADERTIGLMMAGINPRDEQAA